MFWKVLQDQNMLQLPALICDFWTLTKRFSSHMTSAGAAPMNLAPSAHSGQDESNGRESEEGRCWRLQELSHGSHSRKSRELREARERATILGVPPEKCLEKVQVTISIWCSGRADASNSDVKCIREFAGIPFKVENLHISVSQQQNTGQRCRFWLCVIQGKLWKRELAKSALCDLGRFQWNYIFVSNGWHLPLNR